jgi:hypothetical protein
MMSEHRRFVAKLTAAGASIDELLARNLHLDVWERSQDCLVVAADEPILAEIARSGIATVKKLCELQELVRSKSGN